MRTDYGEELAESNNYYKHLEQLDPNDDGYGADVDWDLMVPQQPVDPIQCGRTIKIVYNWRFKCYDYIEKGYWPCRGRADNHYECWDGQDWEWPNYKENDATEDHSVLTSVETDGILETSPSIDGNPDAIDESTVPWVLRAEKRAVSPDTSVASDDDESDDESENDAYLQIQ